MITRRLPLDFLWLGRVGPSIVQMGVLLAMSECEDWHSQRQAGDESGELHG